MTGGYRSSLDSRESRGCGFRPVGVCRARGLPPGACMSQPGRPPDGGSPVPCGGPGVGENSGGNRDGLRGHVRCAGVVFRGRVSRDTPAMVSPSAFLPPVGEEGPGGGRLGSRCVAPGRFVPPEGRIWLILPVVICLSQRLSHACLSISTLYCETANGSLNQLSFI